MKKNKEIKKKEGMKVKRKGKRKQLEKDWWRKSTPVDLARSRVTKAQERLQLSDKLAACLE